MMAERKRQLAMVLDLNKCIGCQTCTIGCKRLWRGDLRFRRGLRRHAADIGCHSLDFIDLEQ